ncbi:MAG: FeoA family protein [Clostridia bacterium]
MENIVTLEKMPVGREAKIYKIEAQGDIKRRILDLGMIEGTKIRAVLRSPLGDPTAYEVRGSMISLRQEDANQIQVVL